MSTRFESTTPAFKFCLYHLLGAVLSVKLGYLPEELTQGFNEMIQFRRDFGCRAKETLFYVPPLPPLINSFLGYVSE